MVFLGVVVLIVGVLTRAPFMWVQGVGVVVVGVVLAFIDASRRFDLLRKYADARFSASIGLPARPVPV